MRVGGKYLVRLDMGLFGIIPKRIWLYAGNPDLSLDNQQERSRLDRGILRDYTPNPSKFCESKI